MAPKCICKICDYTFAKPFNLRRHLLRIHGYEDEEQITQNSSKITQNSSNTTQNSSSIAQNSSNVTHNSSNIELDTSFLSKCIYECEKCNKVFSRKWSMQRHMDKCMGQVDLLSCEYCDKLFSHEKSRFKHYKICEKKKEAEENPEAFRKGKELILTDGNVGKLKTVLENVTPPTVSSIETQNNNIHMNTIDTQNNIQTQNNQNIILVYNPENIEFIRDHIGDEAMNYIKRMYPSVDKRMVMDYSKRLFDLPQNQCIRKQDLKSGHSDVHVGENIWEKVSDKVLYPQLACNVANNMSDYLNVKRDLLRKEAFEKIIRFVDYMADEGYINTDNQEREKYILQEYKSFSRELKLIVFNKTRKLKETKN